MSNTEFVLPPGVHKKPLTAEQMLIGGAMIELALQYETLRDAFEEFLSDPGNPFASAEKARAILDGITPEAE